MSTCLAAYKKQEFNGGYLIKRNFYCNNFKDKLTTDEFSIINN